MNEKQIEIKRRPFLLWSVGIFVLCLLPLLHFFRSGPTNMEKGSMIWLVPIAVSAVIAVAGAFVVCALLQTVRGFRSGALARADLVAPAIIAVFIGVLILGYALVPRATGAMELSFWLLCLAVWIVDAARRMIRNRRDRGTTGPTSIVK